VAGYAGDGFVRAEPDTGVWNNSGFVTTSAELQYRVQVAMTGVYTVWARAWAENGNGNSWHIGLDGQELSTANRMTTDETNPQYNQWVWTNATTEEPVATVNITTTGVHTISVWVREDGVRLDKLVLTTNSVYTPTGTGPTESARTTTCSTTTYTNTTAVLKYGYDPLYRLVNANYVGATSAYTFAYAYDAVGNRTVQTRTVTNTQVITSVYDNANRLTSVNGQAYTWDANGNLLNDGASQYVYDQANRVRVITQTSNVYAFKYNGSGDRLRQLVNGTPTTYTLDLNNALVQVLNDGVNTYLYGNGRIAQYAGSNVDYFLPDALGSVRQLANSAGSVTLAQRYDPFGNPLSSAGSGTSVWAFAGEARDATGLEYLRARYYAPTQGRFTARDVWDGSDNQPMSYNAWLYVYANPVNMTDPSGLNPNCLPGQIGCGPEVTNWFVEEVRYWRAKVQREIEPYDLAICAAEEYKYYDSRGLGEAGASKAKKAGQMMFIYGGGFPYKVMDFNYADAPNSMGNSPSPRANNYPDARPADLVWQVPGGGSVTLCGTCIERSELGNFMLGYIAPFVGMSEQTVVEAAHAIGGANGTWDEAAIRFGARYALQNPSKAGPDERNQDANSLCAFLNQQGIGQMVDPYVRDYTPSRSPLHAGFDHYKDIGYWPPTSWGPPRKVGDADATPLTVGPGIIPNNQYQFHRWRLESWWPTWFTPSYYPENPIRTRVLPTP
jgi:RHS repeat-associated protein